MWDLDIRLLHRDGLLAPGRSFSLWWTRNGETMATVNISSAFERVTLSYRQRDQGGTWEEMDYPVRITTTPCNYGGQRVWWLCPGWRCGRRVAVLYGGAVFACRHCHDLTYRSQREGFGDRSSRRADKLRDRLGWQPGILNGDGGKPKGMHWKTFRRLKREHDSLVQVSIYDIERRVGILSRHLEP
jgi:hypothetical protein